MDSKLTQAEAEIIDRFILECEFKTVTPAHVRQAISARFPERRINELLDFNYSPEEQALFQQYVRTFK